LFRLAFIRPRFSTAFGLQRAVFRVFPVPARRFGYLGFFVVRESVPGVSYRHAVFPVFWNQVRPLD
jgi:hypothetical protein